MARGLCLSKTSAIKTFWEGGPKPTEISLANAIAAWDEEEAYSDAGCAGTSRFARLPRSAGAGCYWGGAKLTSTLTLASVDPGTNFHCRTASSAATASMRFPVIVLTSVTFP
jgi:hypothetical protein